MSNEIISDFKPYPVFDKDSKSDIQVTKEMVVIKQKAKLFFDKTSILTGLVLRLVRDKKAYLIFGRNSFSEFMKNEQPLPESTAWKYLKVADHFYKYLPEIEKEVITPDSGVITHKGGVGTDFSFKMREEAQILEDLKISKLHILSEMNISPDTLVKCESIELPSGEIMTHQQLIECTVKELEKHKVKSTPTTNRAAHRKVEDKDVLAEFVSHIERFTNEITRSHQKYLTLEITQNMYDLTKEKRRLLEDALDQFRKDVTNYEKYNILDEESVPDNLKESDYLTTKEIAALTGKSDRAVREIAKDGEVKKAFLKARKKSGRTEYRIHPAGLPEEYRNLYYAELNRRAQEDEAQRKLLRKKDREKLRGLLTEDQWRKTINIEYCIENYGHLKGEKLEMALKQHNEKNPKEKPLTYSTFLRHIKDYEKDGLKGIADMRGVHRQGVTKVNESDYEYFRDVYCTQNQKPVKLCWEETFGKAKREGRITNIDGQDFEINLETGERLGTFPSEATFKSLVYNRVGEAEITEMRKGKHRFKQTIHFNHVNMTREMMAPGEVYVMDHHTFDVLCKPSDKKIVTDLLNKILYHNLPMDEKENLEVKLKRILKSGLSSKKHVRLWLTNCMDYRTNKQLSWYLHEDAPNTDHVMMTFKWAVKHHGYPDVLMMDNGKDFLANDFAGNPYKRSDVYDEIQVHNLLSYIPTQAHFVLPKESQAKPIERQYRNIIDRFARQWPTYTGKNPAERPEKTTENVNAGNMPTAIEVIEKFDDFMVNILNRKAQGGKALNGKSPDQVWNELHPGKRMPTQKALELMTVRNSKPRQLYGNGFQMDLMGKHFYWGDWMEGLSSTKVKYYAKWDPYEWEKIFVFRAKDHKPMGEAHLDKMSPAFAKTDDERKIVSESIAKKNAAVKRRKVAAREIRKIAAGESFDNMQAYVDHENEVYDAIHDIREDGKKPMKLVQTGLDDLAKKMADSYEKKHRSKQNLDLTDLADSLEPDEEPEPIKDIWDD